MGGQLSSCTRSKSKCYHSESPKAHVVRVAPPDLSSKQKQLLRVAWEKLERDIADVGIITFIGMFKTHPQVQDYFMPFTGLAKTDELYSTTLRQHALRVMATMEKCIHRLDEPERMRTVLETLGARHMNYNAKIEYVDLLGSQFVKAVKDNTPDWNDDLETAWLSLVRIMTFNVKQGWMEKQKLQANREISRKEYLSKKNEARLSASATESVKLATESEDGQSKETKDQVKGKEETSSASLNKPDEVDNVNLQSTQTSLSNVSVDTGDKTELDRIQPQTQNTAECPKDGTPVRERSITRKDAKNEDSPKRDRS